CPGPQQPGDGPAPHGPGRRGDRALPRGAADQPAALRGGLQSRLGARLGGTPGGSRGRLRVVPEARAPGRRGGGALRRRPEGPRPDGGGGRARAPRSGDRRREVTFARILASKESSWKTKR